MKLELKKKIDFKTAKIGVIGLGYVGLPLVVAFAEAGFSVTGYDKNERKVEKVNNGVSDILDISSERLNKLVQNGKIVAYPTKECLRNMDIIIICVPTPLTKSYEPDVSYIIEAVDEIISTWNGNTMVILESTTYPGTSKELIHDVLSQHGYELDKDYLIAYSPERVDPGNKKYHVENTPKVVGGMSMDSTEVGTDIYSTIIHKVIPVSSTEVAEMSKLLENTFRSINIGFINEMALLCEKMGIDIWETIEASSTKPFGFMKFVPGPGIGGHCIPLDPMYLSWKAKESNFFSRFIELAQEVNHKMPEQVVLKSMEALNLHRKSINGAAVLIVGMAYKENIDDLRESPGLKIYEKLKKVGANVDFCDPLARSFIDEDGITQKTINVEYSVFENYDLVVLLSCHDTFDIEAIAKNSKLIIDTKNILKNSYPGKTVRIGNKINVNQLEME